MDEAATNLIRALGSKERGDQVAVVHLADGHTESARLTLAEIDWRARALAAHLARDVPPGARALLLFPTGMDFVVAFLGCIHAGIIAVPVAPPFAGKLDRALARLAVIARDAEPAVALTTPAGLSDYRELWSQQPDLARIALAAVDTSLPAEDAGDWRDRDLTQSTVALLQYTSGSTGQPRGVMLSHANILHNLRMVAEMVEFSPDGVVVNWLPLFHDMGIIGGLLLPLFHGRLSVLMPPLSFLKRPINWLAAIGRYGGTTAFAPNFAYDLCVRKTTPAQRAGLDLRTWASAVNGAEPVRADTLDRFVETFAPCGFTREAFQPSYGLAENTLGVSARRVTPGCAPVVHWLDGASLEAGRVSIVAPWAPGARRHVASGAPASEVRVEIADPVTLARRPPGEVGEILVGGRSVAMGYWGRAVESAEVFGARLADDGSGPFMRTGDLGFLMDGSLFISGRLKDLIIVGGRNHYPQDLERTAEQSHPLVRPGCVAAFSIEGPDGERVALIAELQQDRGPAERDGSLSAVSLAIRRAVAVGHGLDLARVVLIQEGQIPKTTSGKIQRRACKASLLAGELQVEHE